VSPNIVPEYAEVRMYARAADKDYLKSVVGKIRNCAQAAELATGAKMAWRNTAHPYSNMLGNVPLQQVFGDGLRALGAPVHESPGRGSGSTDMGNVSQVVPSIHPYVAICDEPIPGHSREFAAATFTPRGHAGLILGAKAIALTAYRFFTEPDVVVEAKKAFAAR
jgi:metal-dependent amidase/aminoacylase/carboxypeptidase family protein